MTDYSIFSSDFKNSKGRMFLEQEDVNRSCFMRDRDRIIHSSAFRRLKYKTQVFVNNEEEYNALKSSGRMELLENEDIVSTLHDYYTEIRYVKKVENTVINIVENQLVPFMSNYATFYGRSKNANVYSNDFPLFKVSKYPPADELSFYATYCSTYAKYSVDVYRGLIERVTKLRKIIREELSS